MSQQGPRRIIATDVGSTTTKAILIEKGEDGYGLVQQAEAPTTVEAPEEDVMIGVRNALTRLQEKAGLELVANGRVLMKENGPLFVSTSSAGGGLQMMVTGLMESLTAESAQRAALGAGAIVMDVIAMDDGRSAMERVQRIQEIRPDIILVAGGTDEGNISNVLSMAEYVATAKPQARFGDDFAIPVIFAGNKEARELVKRTLGDEIPVRIVHNIRPTLEEEVFEPVREEIHELFLEHVMAHAPGYPELLDLTQKQIDPTPAAAGKMIQSMADQYEVNVVGVDVGGATTDVFSDIEGFFTRSVSANIGMSYSLGNVFVQAGLDNVRRWLPFEIGEEDLRNWIYNKMIRPTTLPETLDELLLEHALGREALRLSFAHHKSLAVGLKGIQLDKSFDDALKQVSTGESLIRNYNVDVIIGSGGLLSQAPRRSQAMLMLLDGMQPQGFCRVYVDSIFMMPQLGVLSDSHPDIAQEVFLRDCLVPLGTVIAPGGGKAGFGRKVADVRVTYQDGTTENIVMSYGDLTVIPLSADESAEFRVIPNGRFDLGEGPGKAMTVELQGGEIGVVLDARGRPIAWQRRKEARKEQVMNWISTLDCYPQSVLGRYADLQREGS